jgi:hypothetical protein
MHGRFAESLVAAVSGSRAASLPPPSTNHLTALSFSPLPESDFSLSPDTRISRRNRSGHGEHQSLITDHRGANPQHGAVRDFHMASSLKIPIRIHLKRGKSDVGLIG